MLYEVITIPIVNGVGSVLPKISVSGIGSYTQTINGVDSVTPKYSFSGVETYSQPVNGVGSVFPKFSIAGIKTVITSYSIHYTKLYDEIFSGRGGEP